METKSPFPGEYAGYWIIEIRPTQRDWLLVARVDCATWFEQLGQLQFADVEPNILTCKTGGWHIAMSTTVGSYGPAYPAWCRQVAAEPDFPITSREEWFAVKAREIGRVC